MSKDIIQFSHANGFPAKSYAYFFECLQPYQINYVNQFGHGDFEVKHSWELMTNQLIQSIETNTDEPVIGLGHSFGATLTLIASQQRPDLFKQVILMDPPLFLNYKRHFIRVAKALNIQGRLLPEARKSRVRKNDFASREQAFEYYKTKALFKDFHPKSYDDYIEHGLKENETGFELAFSPKVEYKIFKSIPYKFQHKDLKVPTTLIHSNKFTVLEKPDLAAIDKAFPILELIEFNGGHLFPQEKPEELAEMIKKLIKSH